MMVAIQVMASDVAVTMGGAEGNFELNAFRPIVINNYLHSALIMADMCDHFREFMIEGTRLNEAKLTENIERSVMMVTALSPVIGYDQASVISHYAIDHDLTLKAGRAGQRRQRGAVRPGSRPARAHPPRLVRQPAGPGKD